MPFIRKMLADKHLILVLTILFLGLFLRIYNFESRLIYGPEQAISMITAAGNLEKFSLLGEINVQRSTSTGLNPFHSPLFNYFLIPFYLLFSGRILPISYVFVALNLVTGISLYLVVKHIFNKPIALLSLLYFIFNAKMVHHSLFIWNLNFLPIIGIFIIWWLYTLSKNKSALVPIFLIGLVSGIGFGLQYLFTPFALLVLSVVVFLSNKKSLSILFFVLGAVVGNLPMLVFDIRHDFYFFRTLWQYLMDVLQERQVTRALHYYDFFYLHPVIVIVWAVCTYSLTKFNKTLGASLILFYIYVNLSSPLINFSSSTGVVSGVNLKMLENGAQIIADDEPPEKYNVVTLWDFDTRAHTLRYLMKYYHNLPPQGLEQYSDVEAIYAYAPENYNIHEPKVYELDSFTPYKVSTLSAQPDGYTLYKLTK